MLIEEAKSTKSKTFKNYAKIPIFAHSKKLSSTKIPSFSISIVTPLHRFLFPCSYEAELKSKRTKIPPKVENLAKFT